MDKARALRIQRLQAMVDKRLENPMAALEVLVSELVAGEAQPALWEGLHGAAVRDGREQELATAYVKTVTGRRMPQLDPKNQAQILVHAADYHQGVLGDSASAENFLERVLYVFPGHKEAYTRLERRFEALGDQRRLIELYAMAASADPKANADLVSKALNKIVPLPATAPISVDACRRLVELAPSNPILLEVLEAHCKKTKRPDLACTLLEQAVLDPHLPRPVVLEQRRRLIALYIGEAAQPANAIGHVEELLNEQPFDEAGRAAAEKLLSTKAVAARAAAALQKARRQARV